MSSNFCFGRLTLQRFTETEQRKFLGFLTPMPRENRRGLGRSPQPQKPAEFYNIEPNLASKMALQGSKGHFKGGCHFLVLIYSIFFGGGQMPCLPSPPWIRACVALWNRMSSNFCFGRLTLQRSTETVKRKFLGFSPLMPRENRRGLGRSPRSQRNFAILSPIWPRKWLFKGQKVTFNGGWPFLFPIFSISWGGGQKAVLPPPEILGGGKCRVCPPPEYAPGCQVDKSFNKHTWHCSARA